MKNHVNQTIMPNAKATVNALNRPMVEWNNVVKMFMVNSFN
jgi:hypothetical protein